MRQAVLCARVSSKDPEREGFCVPAQLKFPGEYAQTHELNVLHKFVDVETARMTGRNSSGEMMRFVRDHKECRSVLVEKTDWLYRNFRDCVTLEDPDVESICSKKGRSSARARNHKLVHGIQLVIAWNYIENLRDDVRKGMREKAAQDIYSSRPHRSATEITNCCARLKLTLTTRGSCSECSSYARQIRTRLPACICSSKPSTARFSRTR